MQAQELQRSDIRQVDNLLLQLRHVLDVHRAELGEQGLGHELVWLSEWIEQFRDSRIQPKEPLDEHAFSMLNTIYNKLTLATSEEQRMQAESPLNSELAEQHVTALRDTRKDIGKLLSKLVEDPDASTRLTHCA